jgi:hypothetical protein
MNRICPSCYKKQHFKSKEGFFNAVKNNRVCRSCSKSGNKNPSFSISPSKEWRDKISKSNTGKIRTEETKQILSNIGKSYCGKKNPFYGKQHSLKSKLQSSHSQKGKNSYWFGKQRPLETKRKMRISKLKLLKENGTPPNTDKGATEYFNKLNRKGFNIVHPFYDLKVGYIADGYDYKNHIWFEFDTPYHLRLGQKQKDMKRQKEIIEYYKKINNPLIKFVRIESENLLWKEFV